MGVEDMKRVKLHMTVMLALVLVFVSACSEQKEAAQPDLSANKTMESDPMAKYKEPVTLKIGYYTNPDSKWPEGSKDTFNDNEFTRMFQEALNVKFEHAFEVPASAYDQKVNLLISSNDIPDFLRVTEAQFKIMAESDMLEDMTSIYQNYASPRLKEVFKEFGPTFIKKVTPNGKLLGIPSTVPAHDQDAVIWIRRDWLKKVGIDLPDVITMADVEKVAKAFVEQDPDQNGKKDTFGIQSTSNFVTSSVTNNTLDIFFTAFKSFPKIWQKDASGNIVYGSTTPETKQALAKLREWYAAGLIDKEFGTIKPDQFAKDLSAGKAGIATGNTFLPLKAFPDSVKNDPKADWNAYMLVAPDGKYYARQPNPMGSIYVVKKGAKNPEAIVKVINFLADLDNNLDPKAKKPYSDSPGTNWSVRPIQVLFRFKDTVKNRFQRFQDAAAGKIKKEQLPPTDVKIFEDYSKGFEALKASPADWAYVLYQYVGGKIVLNPLNVEVYNQYYGLTKTMETKWVNLSKLENEAFMRIIIGDAPLDYFETFVSEWKKQGGDEVTKEVVAEVKKLSE
jgi:putative aldouronate transport system substrate-binding protein